MAHYGSAVEYGLHSVLQLASGANGAPPSARDMAEFQGLSPEYIGKIFTKLEKAGIVASEEGIRGGYRLARAPERISALDVVDALEGEKPLFRCREIRQNCILFEGSAPPWVSGGTCSIHGLMREAEARMREVLAATNLADLAGQVSKKAPKAHGKARRDWFRRRGEARLEARRGR